MRAPLVTLFVVPVLALVPACAGPGGPVEATSLLGRELVQPSFDTERAAELEANLSAARAELEAEPDSELAEIWVGRRLAYLGRYREAVEHYSSALERHPGSYRLLRHRGHRWITLRRFDKAVADLQRAAELARGLPDEIEPDGAPNPSGIPTSSTWFNIQYHLGLARYLRGEYAPALEAWRSSLDSPLTNDDKLVASTHWQWNCLQRLGRVEEAQALVKSVSRELKILENQAYADAVALYRDPSPADGPPAPDLAEDPSAAAYAYGHASWLRARGEVQASDELLRAIVDNTMWAAFGHIAAEVELAR